MRFLLLFLVVLLGASETLSDVTRPNIILFITDDQDIELGSMEFMPKTLKLLRSKGVEFKSGFVTTPICCPSRSTILSGLYVHNHHVLTNNHNCSGPEWRDVHEDRVFGKYLHEAGYRTAYFGKYLNEYDGSYVPPGWTEWMGLIRNSRFYNYTVNFNGQKIRHGFDYESDYLTDLVANDTISFIERHMNEHPDEPFLTVLSFPAPHGPEDPAPQYSEMFGNVETHRTDSWNYAPNPDKQWLLQHTGKMEPVHVVFTDMLHRRRLQTLQSVDDAVQRVLNEVRLYNKLSNTYIIFTSDHGYHLGQYGLIKGKNMPYEFDIKVPFFMRGPGLPRNVSTFKPVSNVDIAPTILDMAGVPIPSHMDGRSILDVFSDVKGFKKRHNMTMEIEWRHTVLIERGKMPKLRKVSDRMLKQKENFNKDYLLENACKKREFRSPCSRNQKWKCMQTPGGRWRIFKCCEPVAVRQTCFCPKDGTNRKRRHDKEVFVRSIYDLDRSRYPIGLSKELRRQWQNELLQELFEDTILRNNSWYQGTFNRKKRNVPCELNGTCLDDPFLSKIDIRRTKVDEKIENLRRKLWNLRDERKKLRHARVTNTSTASECDCAPMEAHPLQSLRPQLAQNQPNRRRARWNSRKWLRNDAKANCNIPQMNCFTHNDQHWRTPPLWPSDLGEFCFCQNSNNNTYWCLRTVNETHNFLYCEFITEFISFYDLNDDPYQLTNIAYQLDFNTLERM
ncbi:hypothetical protein QR680_019198 [Steinernema hermaphroditum]|uniref:Sulfatase N-terminal domain-containing protein n=1 Tax=Steinernema hermaphroditum TaxID=289476 RepID=A0AA39HML0_9BILA|nr:hypothetical protein QR680_019198 [Steinernema hermaphroditum]